MTPLQEYNAIVNTAADLLAALDKLDATNSSIHRSNVNKLRKDLKIQIIQIYSIPDFILLVGVSYSLFPSLYYCICGLSYLLFGLYYSNLNDCSSNC